MIGLLWAAVVVVIAIIFFGPRAYTAYNVWRWKRLFRQWQRVNQELATEVARYQRVVDDLQRQVEADLNRFVKELDS